MVVQEERSKELWLVPKRGSLHQTICLIESLINRNYNETRWNKQKQKNIDNDQRKSQEKRNDDLIETSTIFLEQFEKLQITNPIILKDCENIFVFPFRVILKLLLKLHYLDREELAYFVFSIRDESEIPLIVEKIKKYRIQDKNERDIEINLFKETHIGNITLVQASSASYFENLCYNTGIIERTKIQIPNPGSTSTDKLSSIQIKHSQKDYVKEIVNNKYKNAEAYNFGDKLNLWKDYI